MLVRQIASFFLVCLCLVCAQVHAAEPAAEDAIKRAFENMQIILQDVPGPQGIAYANTDWRIVTGADEWEALSNPTFVTKGVTDQQGVVHLSKALRLQLYELWHKTPGQLWFIENSRVYLFKPYQTEQGYQIAFESPKPEYLKERRLADEAAARNRQLPIPPETYTQAGFDAKRFEREFSDWQARFLKDVVSIEAQLAKDPDYVRKLLQTEDTTALKQTFAQSIDADEKGLSLRQTLLSAYLATRATEGTEVTPSGKVMMDLLLSKNAKPVGFGGAFMDLGLAVQLWYMVFDDMTTLNQQDLKESLIFKGFSPLSLPAHEVPVRDSWPALVFSYHEGSLKLYGMSREMAKILQTIQNAQLF